jgi:hypothetical protein
MVHRIDDPTAAPSLPAPRPAGTPGYFTEGSAGSGGFPATVVRYEFMNMVQEEFAHVVESAGMPLDKTNNRQLLLALAQIFSGGFSLVTSGGTVIVPAWANHIVARLVGAGGGGAWCQALSGQYLAGGGGGAGAYIEAVRAVIPGEAINFAVGVGGAENTDGGQTQVSSPEWQLTAGGGKGAIWYSTVGSSGGDGGAVINPGDLNSAGNGGGDGQAGGGVTATGTGAAGPWGGGVRAAQGAGKDGNGPGAGGGGAYDNGNTNSLMHGGKGANGLIQYRFLP